MKKFCMDKVWTGGVAGNLGRGLLVALLALTITGVVAAQDRDDALRFKGGIGVINVVGQNPDLTLKLNVVRNVSPAAPWRIADLTATIKSDGHIKVVGRGLLLANGNGIGTNAGASVHATLFCGPAATATAFDEAGVALDADGDFRIDTFLSPVPPTQCDSPVLLIRSGATPGQGVWFAAGIQKLAEDNDKDY
ncbi:MAG TPA: hypothetical protein VEG30_02585 [Terriglobales bacterium]|nr:hypothetical protein [Terriglobales bacterium]